MRRISLIVCCALVGLGGCTAPVDSTETPTSEGDTPAGSIDSNSTQAGASEATKPIGELFQVIVNVHDMSAQIAFYRDVMGFPIIYPEGLDDYSAEDFVRLDTGGSYLVLHSGRNTDNTGDEPRLSYLTDDINGMRERLLAADALVDVVRSPAPGVLVADARDPEGNAFHIEEHTDLP